MSDASSAEMPPPPPKRRSSDRMRAAVSAAASAAAAAPPPPPPDEPARKKRRGGALSLRGAILAVRWAVNLRVAVPQHHAPAETAAEHDEREREARARFAAHDHDGNGTLDDAEYHDLLISIGTEHDNLHPRYIEHFLQSTARDQHGGITVDAFLQVYDRLAHFDELLRAPRRRRAGRGEDPAALSKLRAQRRLVCPPVDTATQTFASAIAGGGEHEFTVDTRYVDVEPIGEGAYGVVCEAKDGGDGGAPVAIKLVRPTEDVLQLRCTLRELAILQHFGLHPHPNVLGLRGVVRPPGGPLGDWRDLYLVTELMDADLHQIIKTSQALSEDHCRYFAWQLLRGVAALHAAGVLHRDLKPSNLLVNGNCELRIADFGISRGFAPAAAADAAAAADGAAAAADAHDEDAELFTSYVVTRWYRPPELLCGNKRYGPSVDLWSCGVIIAEILGRAPPFCGHNHMAVLREIVQLVGSPSAAALAAIEAAPARGWLGGLAPCDATPLAERFPDAPAAALDLAADLLRFDATERPTAAAALGAGWLAKYASPDDGAAAAAAAAAAARVAFDYEEVDLNLDHFLLAGLDAVRAFHADYPVRVPELLRFGIMHNRSVHPHGHIEDEDEPPEWNAAANEC